jgi:hypothetical protein
MEGKTITIIITHQNNKIMDKETAKKVFEIQKELTERKYELDYAIDFRENSKGECRRIEFNGETLHLDLYIDLPEKSLCITFLDEYIKTLESRIKELQDALDAI